MTVSKLHLRTSKIALGVLGLAGLVALGLALRPGLARADDDEHEGHERREHHERHEHGERRETRAEAGDGRSAPGERGAGPSLAASPVFAKYQAECGACHLAYPPGLLPARSWTKLLDGLADHFGQNAELDAPTRTALSTWLAENAAESGSHRRSRKVLRSAGSSTPLRISDLSFIRKEHAEVDPAAFTRPAVKTVANCGACHQDAAAWGFAESQIALPR